MISWRPWGPAVFEQSRRERRPVFLAFGQCSPEPGVESLLLERYIPVLVDPEERPDIALRYPVRDLGSVLSEDGRVIASFGEPQRGELMISLRRIAEGYNPESDNGGASREETWSGAVAKAKPIPALDPERPSRELGRIKGRELELSDFDAFELLLYAASEWGDSEAAEVAARGLRRLIEAHQGPSGAVSAAGQKPTLKVNARWARLLWDAYAVTGLEDLARAAAKSTAFVDARLFDPESWAFRNRPEEDCFDADSNAMAALAMMRAWPHREQALSRVEQVLAFLRNRMYDPVLGMTHRWIKGGGAQYYGLLGDNAWALLAFSEAYLALGDKAHRDFAESLLKHLFQELWEREGGGFLDRVPRPEDPLELRRPRLIPELNAVAFEGAWRIAELKGVPNYRRWTEWGLKSLSATPAPALARLQDMLLRGRLDLELVGRLENEDSRRLLEAVHRRYLPRKIISFVDPDDQDYILAHKLKAPSYPRLFGCVELKPKAEADSPEKVLAMLAALSIR
ncbi:MAG: DUF255 domain-containing protein [Elusimicrobia bacterium]|nr:DUF255 domain-containing protein [Elusimicrobiota bacterium]